MRRGRVILLTLLAFALPTAALANSVDFDTGNFISGSMSGTFNTSINVTEVGNLATITIDTGTLTKLAVSKCPTGFTCYDFTGGSVTVDEGGHQVFSDSLSGGLTIKSGGLATNAPIVASIIGALSAETGVAGGTAVSTLVFQGNKVFTGSSDVSYASPTSVPEPSSLLPLGTGLVGLVGMMRRKLIRT